MWPFTKKKQPVIRAPYKPVYPYRDVPPASHYREANDIDLQPLADAAIGLAVIASNTCREPEPFTFTEFVTPAPSHTPAPSYIPSPSYTPAYEAPDTSSRHDSSPSYGSGSSYDLGSSYDSGGSSDCGGCGGGD